MLKEKLFLLLLFIFCSRINFAQNDTSQTHGTIKIGKSGDDKVYIKAVLVIDKYELTEINRPVTGEMLYPFFPGVEGYTFPFNYTRYFYEKFKSIPIDLKGKDTDTVRIDIKVLKNGKVYIKDKDPLIKPENYDEKAGGYKVEGLRWDCLKFMREIKTWEPAYVVIPQKGKFKKQTVIKPDITQLTSQGTLTIVFSSFSFEQ